MVRTTHNVGPEDWDQEMLSVIVTDALKGIDISVRYPSFFKEMLMDSDLREAFLNALEIVEMSQAGELTPPPGPPSHDLSFLQTAAAQTSAGRQQWPVVCRQSKERIRRLLFPPGLAANLAYRYEASFLEDSAITLLRCQPEVEQKQLDVMLEAVQPLGAPGILQLFLSVAVSELSEAAGPYEPSTERLPLRATLHWGEYQQTAVTDEYGQATFPPLARHVVVDEAGQSVTADLVLSLEPVPET